MSKELAQELLELWSDNEETMGEQAAYQVACEMLDIDPDHGYELLHEHHEEINKENEK